MAIKPEIVDAEEEEPNVLPTLGMGAYLPGILLLLIACADWIFSYFRGEPLLDMAQSILLVVSAILLSLPAIVRFQRD
jgi:hypothetical protein